MKKYFVAVLCVLLFTGTAWAKRHKAVRTPVVEAKGNTPVVEAKGNTPAAKTAEPDLVEVGDVVLVVDEDYTWKAQVEDKNLVFGTADFNEARDKCLAYEKAIKE